MHLSTNQYFKGADLKTNHFKKTHDYAPLGLDQIENLVHPDVFKLLTLVDVDGDTTVTPQELADQICDVPAAMRSYACSDNGVVKDAVNLMRGFEGCAPRNSQDKLPSLEARPIETPFSLGTPIAAGDKRFVKLADLPAEMRNAADWAARIDDDDCAAPSQVSLGDLAAAEKIVSENAGKAKVFASLIPVGCKPKTSPLYTLAASLATEIESSPLPAQRYQVPELGVMTTSLKNGEITLLDPCATQARNVCFDLATNTKLQGQFSRVRLKEGNRCKVERHGEQTLQLVRDHEVQVGGLPDGWTALFTPRNNPRASTTGTVKEAGPYTVKILNEQGRPVAMTSLDVPAGGVTKRDISDQFYGNPETFAGRDLYLHFDAKGAFHYSSEKPCIDEKYEQQFAAMFPQPNIEPGVYQFDNGRVQGEMYVWPDRDNPNLVRNVQAKLQGGRWKFPNLVQLEPAAPNEKFRDGGWQSPVKGGYDAPFYRANNKRGENAIFVSQDGLYGIHTGATGFFSGGCTTQPSFQFVSSAQGMKFEDASCVPVQIGAC